MTPAQQKEVLRSLIRCVIVTRPTADTIEARVVWISGAVTPLWVHPPILRGSDVSGYERLVERILALGAQGYQDPDIARRVTAEGFRSTTSTSSVMGLISTVFADTSLTTQHIGRRISCIAVRRRGRDSSRPYEDGWTGWGRDV